MENAYALADDRPVAVAEDPTAQVTTGQSGARVLVFYRAPVDDPDAVERVYRSVSNHMTGTDGLLGNQLMKDITDPGSYVVASDWVDLVAFSAWDKSMSHRRTSPLDPYQDSDPSRRKLFGIYEIVARY